MALSLSMLIIYEGFDQAIDWTFNVVDRSDATVTFVSKAPYRTLYELERMPGISVVEPVRFVPVVFRNGLRTYKGSITGLLPDPELNRALGSDLRPITLPPEGIILSLSLSEILDVRVGDLLTAIARVGNPTS